MKSAKRVAIIGAGASGLTCIKCCLDEDLEPTCFEMSDDIGGIWNYQDFSRFSLRKIMRNTADFNMCPKYPGTISLIRDAAPEDQFSKDKGSIYKSLVTNSSKEMMCYSNFPMPGEYPNYMPHTKVLQYFRLYAENFDLMKYIRFKTNVCSVTKQQDFSSTGQWTVTTKDSNGNFASSVFDAVMICTGHQCYPHLPLELIPGKDVFKGQYMHSKEYKEPQPFEGKRVVIVGTGNSGGDLAVEISRFAKQVFLSTRRGAWIWNRVAYKGYPLDMMILRRSVCLLNNVLSPFMNWYFQRSLNNKFNHENYGLQPTHSVFCQNPTVNDGLPHCIISGTVLVKSNVKRFTETAAIFEDGSVEEVDIVVFATGYTFSFPFLDESVVKFHENDVSLYKNVLPPQLEQPTLFVIGLIDPVGSIIPLSELQSRWASRVLKGCLKLPTEIEMMSDIRRKKERMAQRYFKSVRYPMQVHYVTYADELAEQIGAKPNIMRLFFRDPILAYYVFFGPCTPIQYRLTGPEKWEKAREAILTQWERTVRPTKTRTVMKSKNIVSSPLSFSLIAVFIAIFLMYIYFSD